MRCVVRAALLVATSAVVAAAQKQPARPPTTQSPVARIDLSSANSIWGYADLHVHQFNNLGFGGNLFVGSPFGPPDQALRACTDQHGARGANDIIGNVMTAMIGLTAQQQWALFSGGARGAATGAGAGGLVAGPVGAVAGAVVGGAIGGGAGILNAGHPVEGYPFFEGWPRWDSYTHQQVYADWLARAHDNGLQLIVMYASNNEVFCAVEAKIARSPLGCDDMDAVDREIQGAKAMQAWVDQQHGGPGHGWYRIVYSAKEARDAIGKGQLAVVLGTEVPSLFRCKPTNPACTPEYVREQLQNYYSLGLRQVIPIHNADNAFGGSALYDDLFNYNNHAITGRYFEARDCSNQQVAFHLKLGLAGPAIERMMGDAYSPPLYPISSGQCNAMGLTPVGAFFLKEMMSKHMLIDVDHMSWLTLDAALALARANQYPVLNSHTGFLELSRGDKRSEGQKRPDQVQSVYDLHGVVAPILFQGDTSLTVQAVGSPIPHDCSNSSQSFAQAYLYLAIHYPGHGIPFGSDFNGFASEPSPRFGPDACLRGQKRGQAELGGRVTYPFTVYGTNRQVTAPERTGNRTFDYNVDGLANIGLLPEMVQDIQLQLKASGGNEHLLDPLFRSAEEYIRMWEAAESANVPPPPLPMLTLNIVLGAVDPRTHKATVTITARDRWTNEVRNGTVQVNDTKDLAQATGATGRPISYTPCREFDPTLKAYTGPGQCTVRVSVAGYPTATTQISNR